MTLTGARGLYDQKRGIIDAHPPGPNWWVVISEGSIYSVPKAVIGCPTFPLSRRELLSKPDKKDQAVVPYLLVEQNVLYKLSCNTHAYRYRNKPKLFSANSSPVLLETQVQ